MRTRLVVGVAGVAAVAAGVLFVLREGGEDAQFVATDSLRASDRVEFLQPVP